MRTSDSHQDRRLLWARREAFIMSSLVHSHIVRFYSSYEENQQVVIEMEYCDKGDLRQLLRERNGELLSQKQIRIWFHQIVSAVAYVHDHHIIHRDIKTKVSLIPFNEFKLLNNFSLLSEHFRC